MHLKEKNKRVLLHSCCAICSAQPIKDLKDLGYEPIVYFFNPNIHPVEEYAKRLESQQKLCKTLECELIVDGYMCDMYKEIMVGFENHEEGSERCSRCFEFRLLRTIQKAKELGISNYTTSISISPHKDFKKISSIGKFFSDYFKINFLDINFKKNNGFLKSNLIAKELKLYRQNYCGCENSMRRLKEDKKARSVDA